METCTDLLSADAGTITREKAVFAIICMFYFMQQESGTRKREEQKYFCRTLQRIEQESQILDLTAMQTAMMEYGKALLLWNLGQEEADASGGTAFDDVMLLLHVRGETAAQEEIRRYAEKAACENSAEALLFFSVIH